MRRKSKMNEIEIFEKPNSQEINIFEKKNSSDKTKKNHVIEIKNDNEIFNKNNLVEIMILENENNNELFSSKKNSNLNSLSDKVVNLLSDANPLDILKYKFLN